MTDNPALNPTTDCSFQILKEGKAPPFPKLYSARIKNNKLGFCMLNTFTWNKV